MGRPPPEGARVAYALAQFIFIVRDPIDTLSSCINTTHVHKRLMNEFLGEPGVRELLDVYQSFGYNPSP
jgi:hypothetical protein